MSDGDDIPVCPTCGTDVWIHWDPRAQEGKCQYRHMVVTDPFSGDLYNPNEAAK